MDCALRGGAGVWSMCIGRGCIGWPSYENHARYLQFVNFRRRTEPLTLKYNLHGGLLAEKAACSASS